MKLMIFDLDGTLFDTAKVNYFAYRDALNKYGCSLDYEFFRTHCNGLHYTEFLPEIIKTQTLDFSRIHEDKQQLYEKYLGYAVPNKKLMELAWNVRTAYHTAIVTTASRMNAYQLLKKSDCAGLFQLIITKEDVKKTKPDPEGFLLAMEHFHAACEDTVIFEDSDAGIEAAERAGVHCFVVTDYKY